MANMWKMLAKAVGVTVGLWILFGLAFPLAMTGISQVIFPYQANGSMVTQGGRIVGSQHVGQNFATSAYFWGRPSDTANAPYNAEGSGASNYGPTNKKLIEDIKTRIAALVKATPGLKPAQIPLSLVEASGSGLDPDITVQSAIIQIPRVAKATGLSRSTLARLITQHTLGPQFGILGRQRVNVLDLNLAVYQTLHGGK